MVCCRASINSDLASFACRRTIGSSALDQEIGEIQSTGQVRYMSPMTVVDSFMNSASNLGGARGIFTSISLAALLSSQKYQNTPMDLWGNVKLPL